MGLEQSWHPEGPLRMEAEWNDSGFGSVCLIRDQLTVGTRRILCVLGTLYRPFLQETIRASHGKASGPGNPVDGIHTPWLPKAFVE